jgi:hypothetical protein
VRWTGTAFPERPTKGLRLLKRLKRFGTEACKRGFCTYHWSTCQPAVRKEPAGTAPTGLAWCPGGRTGTKEHRFAPRPTRSTAWGTDREEKLLTVLSRSRPSKRNGGSPGQRRRRPRWQRRTGASLVSRRCPSPGTRYTHKPNRRLSQSGWSPTARLSGLTFRARRAATRVWTVRCCCTERGAWRTRP